MGRKIAALLVILLLWAVLLAGCGQKKAVPAGEAPPDPAGSGAEEVSTVEFKNINGAYVGRTDGNFIEIKADAGGLFAESGKGSALLVPESLKEALGQLKKDDRVEFDCFKNKDQQWEITRLKKTVPTAGQHPDRKIEEADFAVRINGGAIKLGAWDKDMDLVKLLGGPQTEKIEKLGPGADTFTGSYTKRQIYNGLELGFMSPRDNGKTFFMDRIVITKSLYQTARGIKVGDGYDRILQAYFYTPPESTVAYDKKNHTYSFTDGSTKRINFEVKNGSIGSIALFIEHP